MSFLEGKAPHHPGFPASDLLRHSEPREQIYGVWHFDPKESEIRTGRVDFTREAISGGGFKKPGRLAIKSLVEQTSLLFDFSTPEIREEMLRCELEVGTQRQRRHPYLSNTAERVLIDDREGTIRILSPDDSSYEGQKAEPAIVMFKLDEAWAFQNILGQMEERTIPLTRRVVRSILDFRRPFPPGKNPLEFANAEAVAAQVLYGNLSQLVDGKYSQMERGELASAIRAAGRIMEAVEAYAETNADYFLSRVNHYYDAHGDEMPKNIFVIPPEGVVDSQETIELIDALRLCRHPDFGGGWWDAWYLRDELSVLAYFLADIYRRMESGSSLEKDYFGRVFNAALEEYSETVGEEIKGSTLRHLRFYIMYFEEMNAELDFRKAGLLSRAGDTEKSRRLTARGHQYLDCSLELAEGFLAA